MTDINPRVDRLLRRMRRADRLFGFALWLCLAGVVASGAFLDWPASFYAAVPFAGLIFVLIWKRHRYFHP